MNVEQTPRQNSLYPQRIVGLTGGIGTGKSTVSHYLATTYQLPVLDADIYAREAVQPGSKVLNEIAERYGSGILLPDGTLDRRRLGDIIFNCSPERLWLEQQIHPYVRDRLERGIQEAERSLEAKTRLEKRYPVAVLVVPLLFEARMTDLVTEIWVVQCERSQQVERLIERDQLSLEQVEVRLKSQMDLAKKIAQADVVLDNSSSPEALLKQVDLALVHLVPSRQPPL